MVPLFGDVVIGPFNYVQKTANFDAQHWLRCQSAGVSQQATILSQMSEYRQQHVELMCDIMLLSDLHRKLVHVCIIAFHVFAYIECRTLIGYQLSSQLFSTLSHRFSVSVIFFTIL